MLTHNTDAFLHSIRSDGLEHTLLHTDLAPDVEDIVLCNSVTLARQALRTLDEQVREVLRAQQQ